MSLIRVAPVQTEYPIANAQMVYGVPVQVQRTLAKGKRTYVLFEIQ
jgi:hypothetical protein